MVLVNYAGKEINAKLVYYGPGLSGKTTNLEYIYTSVPATHRGKMVSMKTKTERTLFFDFLPLDLGELGGYRTRFLLYTVPGQVYYNATRKLVLKGVDAVVFVADSKRAKMDENRESLRNLEDNLRELSLELGQIPWILQYNKRDLPDAASTEELNRALNPGGVPFVPAIASRGEGVFDTFKEVSKLLLRNLSKNLGPSVLSRPAARPIARPVTSMEAPPEPAAGAPSSSEAPEESPHILKQRPAARPWTPPPARSPEETHATDASPQEEAPRPIGTSEERRSSAPEFIVSDPPRSSEPRTFVPTISPTPAEVSAEEPESPSVGGDAEQEEHEASSSREGARAQNGRPRSGLFGWFRRSKPALEEVAQQGIEPELVAEFSSEALEASPERAPESECVGEPARDEAATGLAIPPLELVRGREAESTAVVEGEEGAEDAEPTQEITVPVVLPLGAREVRLVVRLLVRHAREETEDEDEANVKRATVGR